MRSVVLLSGYTPGLAVARALGPMGVPIVLVQYDRHDVAGASKFVSRVILAPDPRKSESAFVDRLLEVAHSLPGGLLVPASDTALAAASRNRTILERHYVVACPDWEVVEQVVVKPRTYALAEAAGVPVPRTLIPSSVHDVERCAGIVGYPNLIKPFQSHLYFARFRKKWLKAHTLAQARRAYAEAIKAGLEVMVQEFIPGNARQGANYNSYFWGGEPLAEFTARKVRNAPSASGSPCIVVDEPVPEILEAGRLLLRTIGYYGFSCTEFKRDSRDGVYKLMEINGRHNLSALLALGCGINFPLLQYRHLVYGERPAAQPHRSGLYWTDLIRDLASLPAYLRDESGSLQDFLEPYRRPHVDAILDLRDPKPFLKRCFSLASWLAGIRARIPGSGQC